MFRIGKRKRPKGIKKLTFEYIKLFNKADYKYIGLTIGAFSKLPEDKKRNLNRFCSAWA